MLATPKRRRRAGAGGKAAEHAPRQEASTSERLGGKRIKGSGSGDARGDVRVPGVVRIECKSTIKGSFTVTRNTIRKIEAAALSGGEVPIIEIEMLDGFGRLQHRMAVIPMWALDILIDAAKKY